MHTQLRDGRYWLGKLEDALVQVARFMALNRYGQVPDVEDRVSDALAALVEGSHRFKPQPGRDGAGYYLRYVLAYVAGALQNGAQRAKDWSDEAACFTDVAPDDLGVERLWETLPGPDEEPEENLFVLNNGQVASTLEIIELIAGHEERRRIAARLLGVQADDAGLPVRLLQALDAVADRLSADAPWSEGPPEPTPVVTHDLEPVTIRTIRNGVQETRMLSGEELRREIERASRGSVQWTRDEIETHYETDSPWPRWRAADATRSFRSPYRDDNAWPDSVTRTLLGAVLEPWDWIGWADNVLDALLGAEVELDEAEEHAVAMLDRLAEALADEADGSTRAVARVLARIIVDKGVSVKTEPGQTPQEALFQALCGYLATGGRRRCRAQTACVLEPSSGWRRSPPSSACGLARPLRSGRWCCTMHRRTRRGAWRRPRSLLGRRSGGKRGRSNPTLVFFIPLFPGDPWSVQRRWGIRGMSRVGSPAPIRATQ